MTAVVFAHLTVFFTSDGVSVSVMSQLVTQRDLRSESSSPSVNVPEDEMGNSKLNRIEPIHPLNNGHDI